MAQYADVTRLDESDSEAQLELVGAAAADCVTLWRSRRGLRLGKKSRDKNSVQSEVFPHFGAVFFMTQTQVT